MTTYKNEEKYRLALTEYQENEHATLTDLAKKYEFDRACFSRYLKQNNIPVRTSNSRNMSTAEKYDKAVGRYLEGCSINQIHEEFGISKKSFSLYLKKQNIEIRHGFTKTENDADENFFELIDTPEKAYWLGFIAADGCVVSKNNTHRLIIELNKIDALHLVKFRDALQSNIEIKKRANRPTVVLAINRLKIASDLIRHGCVQNKTVDGFVDLEAIKGFESHYIRGYFDGDGFVEKNYKRYRASFVVKSKTITDTIASMLVCFNPRVECCGAYYRIHIEKKQSFFDFLDYLYKDAKVYLDRKYYTYLERRCAHLGSTL